MSEIQGVAPLDSSPEKAITLPGPSIPSPPSPPSLSTLQAWLPLYIHRADRLIDHLNRILSTPRGTDTLLLTIGYSSLLASKLLASISLHHLRHKVARLLAAVSALPKDATVVISASSVPAPRLLRLAQSLKALSAVISDFRNFARLWGLLSIWRWGRGLIDAPPADATQRRIAWTQVAVNIAYQYLENGAYLAGKGVLGWDKRKQSWAWAWSSRFWAAHVALDIYRLLYELSLVRKKNEKGEQTQVEARWKRELAMDLAWAPLTLHWSTETGLVGEFWVGFLGSIAGFIRLSQAWKTAAE